VAEIVRPLPDIVRPLAQADIVEAWVAVDLGATGTCPDLVVSRAGVDLVMELGAIPNDRTSGAIRAARRQLRGSLDLARIDFPSTAEDNQAVRTAALLRREDALVGRDYQRVGVIGASDLDLLEPLYRDRLKAATGDDHWPSAERVDMQALERPGRDLETVAGIAVDLGTAIEAVLAVALGPDEGVIPLVAEGPVDVLTRCDGIIPSQAADRVPPRRTGQDVVVWCAGDRRSQRGSRAKQDDQRHRRAECGLKPVVLHVCSSLRAALRPVTELFGLRWREGRPSARGTIPAPISASRGHIVPSAGVAQ
jgi:hypothetical protein